jgi:hypothetical protein
LHVSCAAVDCDDPNIEYRGVRNDGSADSDPRKMVRGEPLSEFADNDDELIVQCLEHVRQHDLS